MIIQNSKFSPASVRDVDSPQETGGHGGGISIQSHRRSTEGKQGSPWPWQTLSAALLILAM